MTGKRTVIYARVSTEAQTEGTSIESQVRRCTEFCGARGYDIAGVEIDAGVSGALLDGRPAIQRALETARSGGASAIVIYRMDRAGREVEVLSRLRKEPDRAGAELLFADGLATGPGASGRFIFTQMSAVARYERDLIGERTLAGQIQRALQGSIPTGKVPYGYRWPSRREIAEWRASPASYGQVTIVPDEAPPEQTSRST